MTHCLVAIVFLAAVVQIASGFRPSSRGRSPGQLNMLLDGLAELSVAAKLTTADMRPPVASSLAVAKTEVKQGMYKEYTVETTDDSYLDVVRRGYKTADETEDGKGKYWTILAVLLFGSFTIPMVQYYW